MSMPLSAKSSAICQQNQKLFFMLPRDQVSLLPQSEKKKSVKLQCFHENSIVRDVRSSRSLIIEICQTDTYSAEPLTQLFVGFSWLKMLKFEICQIYG